MPNQAFLCSSDTIQGTMKQQYYAPHPLLRLYIAHYTIVLPFYTNLAMPLALIPDVSGCIICGITPKAIHTTLWGPTTQTVVVNHGVGFNPCNLFIEFLPGGAHRLTGFAQEEFVNRIVPLTDCLPALHDALCEAIYASWDTDDLIKRLDLLFLRLLFSDEKKGSDSIVLPILRQDGSTLSVKDLATATCYSERHLNRLFYNEIGVSAKNCLRLVRLNRAIKLMQNPALTLTECAYLAGYYDQSHFIREFREVCGVSPSTYRSNKSVFYNEQRKF